MKKTEKDTQDPPKLKKNFFLKKQKNTPKTPLGPQKLFKKIFLKKKQKKTPKTPPQGTVVDGATGAPEEEVQENSARVGFFRLLLLEISTADIFEVYTEKMNFPGGLVSANLQFY